MTIKRQNHPDDDLSSFRGD